ncbi:MAG TPA: hypothetical protein VGH07_07140, partial [Chthoniobacterales bacterium]
SPKAQKPTLNIGLLCKNTALEDCSAGVQPGAAERAQDQGSVVPTGRAANLTADTGDKSPAYFRASLPGRVRTA